MGLAKRMMMEDEARGWHRLDDYYVCKDCINDAYLAEVVRAHATASECTFCGRSGDGEIAAPLDEIVGPIADAVFYHFNEPTHAGVPWDEGQFIVEVTDTRDVLETLGLMCNDELFDVIAGAFVNDTWVRAGNGHWATSHDHEVLRYSWDSFVKTVKHRTRFHFHLPSAEEDDATSQEIEPSAMLPVLCKQMENCGLIRHLDVSLELLRARVRKSTDTWPFEQQELSAPPPEHATAGRMNPAGIPYLYLALDEVTAVAETRPAPTETVVIGTFAPTRPLCVVDLTRLPALPSIFDAEKMPVRQGLLFLKAFVEDISQPINKDGHERLDYVPTQVFCEYLAQVFKPAGCVEGLDGVLYPSAVHPSGMNLVLFPSSRRWETEFDAVKFLSARHVETTASVAKA